MLSSQVILEAPIVEAILPKFGSSPKSAVFTKSEFERAFAAICASSFEAAFITSKATAFLAPSPSATISIAISCITSLKASRKASLSYAPDFLFANNKTVSFVEVSPSTEIALKVV